MRLAHLLQLISTGGGRRTLNPSMSCELMLSPSIPLKISQGFHCSNMFLLYLTVLIQNATGHLKTFCIKLASRNFWSSCAGKKKSPLKMSPPPKILTNISFNFAESGYFLSDLQMSSPSVLWMMQTIQSTETGCKDLE